MELMTPVTLNTSDYPIGYGDTVFLLGSCFSEHIGTKLSYYQFRNTVNPFGTLFQPTAIAGLLDRVAGQHRFVRGDLVHDQGLWQCLEVHSRLNDPDFDIALDKVNSALEQASVHLKNADLVIVTLGTANAYRYVETRNLVANCHKLPKAAFEKELLSISTIEEALEIIRTSVASVNPKAQVLITISPVRHLRDGFVENQRSKAHLIAAVHSWLDGPGSACHYFPAYELVMDELRDYRFYDRDLVHPNALAVDYIWERFCETWIRKEARPVMREVETIQKGIVHRPFHRDSEEYRQFRATLKSLALALEASYPFMRFGL